MFTGFMSMGIIQADGNAKTSTRNQVIAIALNVVLDPFLIFGFGPIPAMGLFGAGLATVISRSIGTFLNLWYIFSGKTSICISRECFSWSPKILKDIIRIGTPASLSNSVSSIGMILFTSLVGGFGTAALAAFGVGIRLESLALMPVIAMYKVPAMAKYKTSAPVSIFTALCGIAAITSVIYGAL